VTSEKNSNAKVPVFYQNMHKHLDLWCLHWLSSATGQRVTADIALNAKCMGFDDPQGVKAQIGITTNKRWNAARDTTLKQFGDHCGYTKGPVLTASLMSSFFISK